MLCDILQHFISVNPVHSATPSLIKTNDGHKWYIVLIFVLITGIIAVICLSKIALCIRRKCTSKKHQSDNEPQIPEANITYQQLDISKINKEDNYQPLTAIAGIQHNTSDEDSNYTELSQTRDEENIYQSLI